jgi:hypothetical protein
MGIEPRLISLMAQNNPNGGPPIPYNALKFGIAYAYDSSKRPFWATAHPPVDLQPLKTPQNPEALTPEKSRSYYIPISLNRSEEL